MIQIITSPDIVANNKLAKKISKQLDIFKVNINDIISKNDNLNKCVIDLNLLLDKHKRLIIYGQYNENNMLVNKLMEYIMSNLYYQLVIHNLNNNVNSYYKLNEYHRLRRYDNAIVM